MLGGIIGGHKLIASLGSGRIGVVYRAEDRLLGRTAAVKVLHAELCASEQIVQRFFAEARSASAARHPGIADIYTFGFATDGVAYIAMEFLDGETLGKRLEREGVLPLDRAIAIAAQVAAAIAVAHERKIVHRNLKPNNIFLVPASAASSEPASAAPDQASAPAGGERIKVVDFGVARLASEDAAVQRTGNTVVLGTPAYMAPEQCEGLVDIDHRADLYALGCTLYHMLCGRPPFEGTPVEIMGAHVTVAPPPPRTLAPAMPASLEAVVLRLLAKRPDDRFASAAELVQALDDVEQEPTRRDVPMPRRPRRVALVAAGALLAVAAGGALLRPAAVEEPDGRAILEMCRELRRQGRPDQAIRACQQALEAGGDAALAGEVRAELESLRRNGGR
ncbi:MAG TPA: serine/threonine-protein kinase [Kofleriaceae bacterium]|nr:serine/threonine-protein kinase [Kofleriaceae bacterium]